LLQIQDVNAEVDGFMATLLHFGNVHIQTAGEQPNFVFESVPHPYEVSKKILDLHEVYLARKERESEDSIEKELESVISKQSTIEKRVVNEGKQEFPEEISAQIIRGIESTKEQQKQNGDLKEEGELKEGKEVDL
jgi:anion-transporting  ArsA/GET3 family ATPase